jgi:histidine ammonia-lyase
MRIPPSSTVTSASPSDFAAPTAEPIRARVAEKGKSRRSLSIDGILNLSQVYQYLKNPVRVTLSDNAHSRMALMRHRGDEAIQCNNHGTYGRDRGLGALKDVPISSRDRKKAQHSVLVQNHTGLGPMFLDDVSRLSLLLLANAMARGHMSVRPELAERLLDVLNAGVVPQMPSIGSLGNGDLQTMTALALVVCGGDAEASYKGEIGPAREILKKAGLKPTFELIEGEALAIKSGSIAVMASLLVALQRTEELCSVAEAATALFSEALRAEPSNFDRRTHEERHFPAAARSAREIANLLDGSTWSTSEARAMMGETTPRVQDTTQVRSSAQVYGILRDTIANAKRVLSDELQSSTSNPLLFAKDDESGEHEFVSGASWYGGRLGFSADALNQAVTQTAILSTDLSGQLISAHQNYFLGANLVGAKPGVNIGMASVHADQVALIPMMQQHAYPAGLLSRPFAGGQQDNNSMAMTSVLNLGQNLERLADILARELIIASQGIDLTRRKLGSLPMGAGTGRLHSLIREHIEPLVDDRVQVQDIQAMRRLIDSGQLFAALPEREEHSEPVTGGTDAAIIEFVPQGHAQHINQVRSAETEADAQFGASPSEPQMQPISNSKSVTNAGQILTPQQVGARRNAKIDAIVEKTMPEVIECLRDGSEYVNIAHHEARAALEGTGLELNYDEWQKAQFGDHLLAAMEKRVAKSGWSADIKWRSGWEITFRETPFEDIPDPDTYWPIHSAGFP